MFGRHGCGLIAVILGKTLLAKAVANQTSATFLRVVGSELIQKYLGEGKILVIAYGTICDFILLFVQAPSLLESYSE